MTAGSHFCCGNQRVDGGLRSAQRMQKLIEDELQERHELEQCKRDLENLQASEYQCKEELKQTRQELDQCKKDLERFQARMAFEASVDMGSSGASCEDINNPCRESELRKMYDKLRLQKLSKHIMDIKMKSKKDKTISETNEKERLKAMLKEIFDKAQQDMSKKKEDFLFFFQVDLKKEEGEKGELNKTEIKNTRLQTKQLKYIELAIQNIQMIMFHEEARDLQTMYKQPDPLCELADECYKVGCLLALHNPPLLLDWEKKEPSDYLPPITMEDTSAKTAL
ncbi:uncharacterized protein LOC122331579 [Puntigrus tetrazona]|uniref:uncharacterized protein LOC122331579 n=1 Tax=Puntigrus tetrazona TaxID=1606681 RepID=UPI001C89A051|nr:uncharacterized protein LOC122331579 [Puntigrus tetrazona]